MNEDQATPPNRETKTTGFNIRWFNRFQKLKFPAQAKLVWQLNWAGQFTEFIASSVPF